MNLTLLFKGFIRNYAKLQLHKEDDTLKKFTERELGYFAQAGEMIGYFTFQEEKQEIKGKERYCDLMWATYNLEKENFTFDLHLEHENSLTAEETLETKLTDASNLIAINWAKPDTYSNIFDTAKAKIKKYSNIENILLILKHNTKNATLVHSIELSRIGKKIEITKCDGLIKTTEAGFFYGILKSEIEKKQWEKLIEE